MVPMTSTDRASSALEAPDDLIGYPVRPKATATYRAHNDEYGPWWFSTAPSTAGVEGGRFDLPAPEGTCYVATSVSAAVREYLGKEAARSWVSADSAKWKSTAVSQLDPADRPSPGTPLANTKVKKAARFHTDELHTHPDYRLTRQWAAAFRRAGFGGLRYRARFSTGDGEIAEGWFADAGAPRPEPPYRTVPRADWTTRVGLVERPGVIDSTYGAIRH